MSLNLILKALEIQIFIPNNPLIANLNINSLRKKIRHLKDTLSKLPIDILCVDETMFDLSFPVGKSKLKGTDKHNWDLRLEIQRVVGKLFIFRESIVKRIKNLEIESAETICLELTILNLPCMPPTKS